MDANARAVRSAEETGGITMAGIKNEEELFQTYCKIANGIYDSVEDEFLEGLRDGAEEYDIPTNVVKNAEAHPDD